MSEPINGHGPRSSEGSYVWLWVSIDPEHVEGQCAAAREGGCSITREIVIDTATGRHEITARELLAWLATRT